MRSTRRRTALVLLPVTASLLAACGSDPPQDVSGPNYASVVGGGRELRFPNYLERASYPNACSLLPDSSAQALLGAPATRHVLVGGCSWNTGVASLPSLQISFVQIGFTASDVFGQREPGESSSGSAGVGRRSRIYRVNSDMTTRVDVLKPRVFFRVDVSTPTTTAPNLDNARQVALRAAQIVSSQVS